MPIRGSGTTRPHPCATVGMCPGAPTVGSTLRRPRCAVGPVFRLRGHFSPWGPSTARTLRQAASSGDSGCHSRPDLSLLGPKMPPQTWLPASSPSSPSSFYPLRHNDDAPLQSSVFSAPLLTRLGLHLPGTREAIHTCSVQSFSAAHRVPGPILGPGNSFAGKTGKHPNLDAS